MLTVGSLFSGIGGLDLGLERAGMQIRWQVENDPFCQAVLAKHWPDVERFADVKECGRHNLAAVDLIAGGFPCQPHSVAGKQEGAEDDRNLWPEYRRIVAELRPDWVLAENVPGIRTTILDDILSDLESLAYTATTIDIPACGVGAPHRRHRFFIVAHTDCPRLEERESKRGNTRAQQSSIVGSRREKRNVAHTTRQQCDGGDEEARPLSDWWKIEPAVGRVVDGIPNRMDRLRTLGNAVVPAVAEWIGQRIVEVENECS